MNYASTDEASASPQSVFTDVESSPMQTPKHEEECAIAMAEDQGSASALSEVSLEDFLVMDSEEFKLEENLIDIATGSLPFTKTQLTPQPMQARGFANSENSNSSNPNLRVAGNPKSNSSRSRGGSSRGHRKSMSSKWIEREIESENEMKVEEAFNVLFQASKGVLNPTIPIRAHASPITPSESCFYVSTDLTERKRKRVKNDDKASICVKYQSFHNTEVWWSPKHGHCLGVVARAMSRKNRSQKNDSSDRKTNFHGFKGRWFSLIRREEVFPRNSNVSVKSLLVPNVPSLVHFCTKPGLPAHADLPSLLLSVPTKVEPEEEPSSAPQQQREEHELVIPCRVIKEDVRVEGDLVIEGKLAVNNLRVKGDLVVDGSISGQLVTRPGAADYAEWFAYLDKEESIECGMVVQLRSPQQKITLNTSGEGPHMVVSTQPSVAAGVPSNANQSGALCAFLGQVPVRVRGPVRCGDFLYPSGKNDGLAVPAKVMHVQGQEYQDPIGTAMTSCASGDHVVLAFIRWQHNLKWQMAHRTGLELKRAVNNIASLWPYATITWLVNVRYWMADRNRHKLEERRTLGYFTALLVWVLFHLPSYHAYVFRDIYVVVPSLILHTIFGVRQMYSMLGSNQAEGALMFLWALNLTTFSSFIYASIRLKIAATHFALESNSSSNWMLETMVPRYNHLFMKFTDYLEKEDKNDPLFSNTKGPMRYITGFYNLVRQRLLNA